MLESDIRKSLLEEPDVPKEVRTNDGRVFMVRRVEQWALSPTKLVVLAGPEGDLNVLSNLNIASIGSRPGLAF